MDASLAIVVGMTRSTLGWVLLATLGGGIGACGGGESPGAEDAETVAPGPVSAVSLLQAVEVPLLHDGEIVAERVAPIIRDRGALVRIGFDLDGDSDVAWGAEGLDVRIDVGGHDVAVTTEPGPDGAEIGVPGGAIGEGASLVVHVTDVGTGAVARWPGEGTFGLDARDPGPLRVVLVPVEEPGFEARADTSATQLALFESWLLNLYPVNRVELSVRPEPLVWSGGTDDLAVTGAAVAVARLRTADGAAPDELYYGLVPGFGGGREATQDFVEPLRAAIGNGDTIAGSSHAEETMAHELGHVLGRPHAPCGGARDPDIGYPYDDGIIGVDGFEAVGGAVLPGDTYRDMMSYCGPFWISDHNYGKIYKALRSLGGGDTDVAGPPDGVHNVFDDSSVSVAGTILEFTPSGNGLPVPDVQACVLGMSDVDCARTDRSGEMLIEGVPASSRLALTLEHPDYAPAIISVMTSAATDLHLKSDFRLIPLDVAGVFAGLAGAAYPREGTGVVALIARDADTNIELEGVSATLEGSAPAYLGEAGPDASLSSTSPAGVAVFFEVPVGRTEVFVQHPTEDCRGVGRFAWPGKTPGTFEVEVVEGGITYVRVKC